MGEPQKYAERFHVWDFVEEELKERGWSLDYLAFLMTRKQLGVNRLTLDFMAMREEGMILGEETAEQLADAFGVSKEFFLNLDKAWREPRPVAGEVVREAPKEAQ